MAQKEGLLCPECLKEFSSVDKLHVHFNNAHNETNTILNALKKAKNSVENIFVPRPDNPFEEEEDEMEFVSTAFYEISSTISCVGFSNNKLEEFRKIRKRKVRSAAMDVSSMILKLEKLLCCQEMTSKQRREFEQSIVEWVDDELVPLCPGCGHKFGLNSPLVKGEVSIPSNSSKKWKNQLSSIIDTVLNVEASNVLIRKKHHCRLCGSIICAWCSSMLPTSAATRLVDLVNSSIDQDHALFSGSSADSLNMHQITWRGDSLSSLDSGKIKPFSTSREYAIRCCNNCRITIDNKWSKLIPELDHECITSLYTKMSNLMKEVLENIETYTEYRFSLMSGSSEYSYEQTKNLRQTIVEKCLRIDSIAKQFKSKSKSSLDKSGQTENTESPVIPLSQKESLLYAAVAKNAMYFLQNNFACLQEMPTLNTVLEIQKNKRKTIKESAILEARQSEILPISSSTIRRPTVEKNGWAPSTQSHTLPPLKLQPSTTTNPFDECDETQEESMSAEDQLLTTLATQMENVRIFIVQAQNAGKYEEADILKKNMLDLETEFERLCKAKKKLSV